MPFQLKVQHTGTVGMMKSYFDDEANRNIVSLLAEQCYLPVNRIMFELIKSTGKQLKLTFSISGTALELLQHYRPDVIKSLKKLYNTGCVEFLGETYYNSLACLYSKAEFRRQALLHDELIHKLFGATPVVFRNTELVHNNDIAIELAKMGYKAVLCESVEKILGGRSCNQTFAAPGCGDFGVLLRNVRMSDDIAFRFDDATWNEQPLTAEKFAAWVHGHDNNEGNINIFFDYETFGIHKKGSTGIFDFLRHMPAHILSNKNWRFTTPGAALEENYPTGLYDVSQTISWEDRTLENCVWCENMMQNNMLKKVYSLEGLVKVNNCPDVLKQWGRLQSADHFYYMSLSGRKRNDCYGIQNPFNNPEDAYKSYKDIITDFEIKLIEKGLAVYRNNNGYRPHPQLY